MSKKPEHSIDQRYEKWVSEDLSINLSRNELVILRFIGNLNFVQRFMQTNSEEDLAILRSALKKIDTLITFPKNFWP